MIGALQPNKAVSSRTSLLILGGNALIALLLWAFYPSPLLPHPSDVGRAWLDLVRSQGMLSELYVSFMTNLEALGIASLLSLGLAYLTVLPAMRPLVSFLSKSRFFGMTGFVVLFTVLFGAGHGLKVALLVFGISVFFLTSMAEVVADVPRQEFDHARTLRMGEWRVVWECIVLGRGDYAFEVLRQNAAISWMMLTMVEGLSRSEGGIGTILLNENKHFHLASIFAIQLTVLLVGILQDWGLLILKRIVCPYSELTRERQ